MPVLGVADTFSYTALLGFEVLDWEAGKDTLRSSTRYCCEVEYAAKGGVEEHDLLGYC